MRARSVLFVSAVIAVVSFAAGRLVSQGQDEDKKKKEAEAFMAYATPGKEHQFLAKRAGKWDYKARMWMAPGAPPTEMKGKSEFKMVMGGRYRIDETEGEGLPEFGGQPFHGMGVTGFDNFKKKFVSAWIDDMGTGIMILEGEASKDGKELVFTGEQPDLMGTTGKKMMKIRTIEKYPDDDHFNLEMHMPGPDGKEFKTFELECARKK